MCSGLRMALLERVDSLEQDWSIPALRVLETIVTQWGIIKRVLVVP